jgi:putative ABC transport system permease protein
VLRLALRNTLRQRTRSAIALAAISVGVAGLILSGGFVQDIVIQLGEALIHSQAGHVQVNRQGFFKAGTRSPEKFLIDPPQPLRQQLAGITEADDVLARINFSGLISNGRTDLAIIGEGVEPDREAKLGTYLKIRTGRQLNDRDAFGILVGDGVAAALGLRPGDQVTLLVSTSGGALNTLDFDVVGAFQTFSKDFDVRAVRIPLAAAQTLLDTQGVNTLVLSLKETGTTAPVAERLRRSLDAAQFEVKTWYELSDFYEKTVDLYERQFGVLRLIILFMVLLAVANSVNMTMTERVGEFGTMRALGNRRRQVFRLIIAESIVLGAAGSLIGALLGVLLAAAISAVGIPMPPPPNSDLGFTARIQIVPVEIGLAFAVGMIATVAASLLPAWRTTRTPIVDALRQIA